MAIVPGLATNDASGGGVLPGALGDGNEVVPFTAAAAIMRLGKISSAQDYWCAERPAIG